MTALEKISSIYATIIAALQDLVNVNSRRLKQPCFSFITSNTDEIPDSIVDLFYESSIKAEISCIREVLERHK